mgnify:CR=1 FL=1
MLNSGKVIRFISLALQQVIWAICLILSIAASIFYFSALSKNPQYQMIIPIMVITIESLAQLILSRGKAEWKTGLLFRGGLKVGLYIVYIVFFGVLSCMSYFVSHMAVQERVIDRITYQEDTIKQQIERNEQQIETLNKHLLTESETGYGRQSEKIIDEIKRLKDEQTELINKLNTSAPPEETQDTYRDMAKVIKRFSADTLKLLSFGVLALFVFSGLIILNPDYLGKLWDVTDDVTGVTSVTVTDKNETVKHVTKKPVTRNSNKVTVKHVTNVTGDLCICGCGKPRTGKGLYFSGACRTRVSRRNKKEAIGV